MLPISITYCEHLCPTTSFDLSKYIFYKNIRLDYKIIKVTEKTTY